MPLPDTIPLRYTEEDAGYMSVRPVVKQTFRLPELLDMVVSVAGKDASRVQQIFRSGTVVYHGYRYWWDALSAERPELEKLLAGFPDDDPSRSFVPQETSAVLFDAKPYRKNSSRNILPGMSSSPSPLRTPPATKNMTTVAKPIFSAPPFLSIRPNPCSPPRCRPPHANFATAGLPCAPPPRSSSCLPANKVQLS